MGARLAAYLSYRDAPAALRWMEAIGFTIFRRSARWSATVNAVRGRFVGARVRPRRGGGRAGPMW
ncbi:hypothetical protein SAMN05660657_05034 [Geodermatophilus amargosae]|uniref:Uncharacterized protein n=1 Tax=Geodermatophilus amargosae TaxID=1296565 RepID=A0A1I7CY18_9ACTN|nr:hypothetical protein SAMN05660657_05034 [Geodermatophilus amargosae]